MFDATHVEVKRWFTEGLVDGVRIDHPDGLSDPAGYLAWLRELTGPDAWIVIEKILAVDEALDPTLPVAGTTGYDALREIGGLFVDPTGRQALTELVDSAGDDYAGPRRRTRTQGRGRHRDAAQRAGPAVPGHRRRHRRRPPRPRRRGRRAAQPRRRVPVGLPVAGHGAAGGAGRNRRRGSRISAEPLAIVAAAVDDQHGGRGAAAAAVRRRHRQVDGGLPLLPRRAAGVAQRGRRRARVVRRRRRRVPRPRRGPGAAVAVGDDDAVHPRHQARRGRPRPHRRAVAGAVAVGRARRPSGRMHARRPTRRPALFLWQNVFGVWPADGHVTDELRERLHAYAEKAIREAGAAHHAGTIPTTSSSRPCTRWLDEVLDGPVGHRADRHWSPGSTSTAAATRLARS